MQDCIFCPQQLFTECGNTCNLTCHLGSTGFELLAFSLNRMGMKEVLWTRKKLSSSGTSILNIIVLATGRHFWVWSTWRKSTIIQHEVHWWRAYQTNRHWTMLKCTNTNKQNCNCGIVGCHLKIHSIDNLLWVFFITTHGQLLATFMHKVLIHSEQKYLTV